MIHKQKALLSNCASFLKNYAVNESEIEICKYADEDAPCLTLTYECRNEDFLLASLNDFCRTNNCMHFCTWTDDENAAWVAIELIEINAQNSNRKCALCSATSDEFEVCQTCIDKNEQNEEDNVDE